MILKFKKGTRQKLSKNFSAHEFDCKCSRKSCKTTLISTEQVLRLQILRNFIGPLKITSGYRCYLHNKAVGGGQNSQHRQGTATDIVPVVGTIREMRKVVDIFDFPGVGFYKNFIHIDSRDGRRARWSGK